MSNVTAPSAVLYTANSLGTVPASTATKSFTSLTLPGYFTLAGGTTYAVVVSPQTTASSAQLKLFTFTNGPTGTGYSQIKDQYSGNNGASWSSGASDDFGFRLSDDAGISFTGNRTWYDHQTGNSVCSFSGGCGSCCGNMPTGGSATFSSSTYFAVGFTAPNDGELVNFGLSSISLALWTSNGSGFGPLSVTAQLMAGTVGTGASRGLVSPSGTVIASSTASTPTVTQNAGVYFTMFTE